MQKIVQLKRWKLAQQHEKKLWQSINEKQLKEHLKYYKKKSQNLLQESTKNLKSTKNINILQIGPGPIDIINQIKIGNKYSIDPLADFYKKKFSFNYKETKLIQGVGENLPYEDHFFDIVIFANVLDHTTNPKKVLSEINRVLRSEGILYIEAHFYQKSFIMLSKVFDFLKKTFTGEIFNPCHPHMFQIKELKKLITKNFKIYKEKIGEDIEREVYNLDDLKKHLKNQKLTRKIPAFLGMLGLINYTCFCKKK